jgi:hypothetical protein
MINLGNVRPPPDSRLTRRKARRWRWLESIGVNIVHSEEKLHSKEVLFLN